MSELYHIEYDPDFDQDNQNTVISNDFFGAINPKIAFIFGLIVAIATSSVLALFVLLIVYFKV